ncbi:hypothetical protein [Vitiosangium sp. GDMCC 1.1324]|uniref:hypothetical protein n=1 Tax=Vitiosangium sp. (strain GDMCC 1.1324) TaxID=2138576 RepID=UPI00130E5921|nr:hypothetical protein [Vitiosangium sp. GDMCC 1.1324]
MSGSILLNGAPIIGATCEAMRPTVLFRDTSTGKEVFIPSSCDPNVELSFSGRVYVGTYEVWSKDGLTAGESLLLPSLQVTSDISDLTLDVQK